MRNTGLFFSRKLEISFVLTSVKLLLYVLWKQIVIQFIPNGLINEIKTEGYRIDVWVNIDSE